MCIWAKPQRRINASVWANSSSVSSGKAHDEIRGDGRAAEKAAQQRHRLQIPGGVVLPVHPPERCVTAALHGEVKLRAEVRQRRCPAAELLRHGAGLQTAQPQPQSRRRGAEGLHQINQRLSGFQIPPPGGDLNPRQYNLPVPLRCQLPPPAPPPAPASGSAPAPGRRG